MVGIGGGKTIDTAKYAATRYGLPMVSVATSLANDGIASPVASLINDGHQAARTACTSRSRSIVDLDFVENGPDRQTRAGIGDVVSNISALADWELARQVRGEPVDGLAVVAGPDRAPRRCSTTPATSTDDAFVTVLAEALILGGLAMAVCGSQPAVQRRLPRDHRTRIDALYPGHRARTASRPGSARCSAPSCAATQRAVRASCRDCLAPARAAAAAGRRWA